MIEKGFKAEPAKRPSVYLTVLITGPSGSGKTYSALRVASGIGKNIILIDTETKPASLYADEFKFRRIAFAKPFSPDRYVEAYRAAMELKPDVIVTDSVTHEWFGSGGIINQLDIMPEKNQILKWKVLTPKHDKFVESTVSRKCHHIVTCRGKEKYAIEERLNREGIKKMTPIRIGMRPLQRKDFLYEFMLTFVLDPDTHNARILNNMTKHFREWDPRPLTEDDGKLLKKWAEGRIS